jgi:phosphoglycolate phosphatase-like HAD superfamily hydrolase
MREIPNLRELSNPDWRPSKLPLPATIELINPHVRRGQFRVALFDFDGTLSLIREGWPRVMVEMMLARLREQNLIRESEAECAVHVENFVMALNGHPTIKQMERFAEEVTTRGGKPDAPPLYLQQFIEALLTVVRGRWESLESGRMQPGEWVVPNTHSILRKLQARGVPLTVASGTDLAHVLREVELLQLTPHVGGRVKDNDANFRKRDVIDRTIGEFAVRGEEVLGFGDGVVETQEVKRVGGVAVGVASSEQGVRSVNRAKRDTLVTAGADIIIPDYEHAGELLAWLWGEE